MQVPRTCNTLMLIHFVSIFPSCLNAFIRGMHFFHFHTDLQARNTAYPPAIISREKNLCSKTPFIRSICMSLSVSMGYPTFFITNAASARLGNLHHIWLISKLDIPKRSFVEYGIYIPDSSSSLPAMIPII